MLVRSMSSSNSTTSFGIVDESDSTEQRRLILAIPKKGRLNEQCMKLLAGAGIEFHRPNRLDVAQCTTLPITLVFLPAADIASYVGEGNVDVGITGIDVVEESLVDVNRILDLGFGKCKLSVQAPVKSNFTDSSELAGGRIVTSYPNLAKKFFDQYDTAEKHTQIKFVSGSVEAACGLGLADAVVDLVETGTTMKAAGLCIVDHVLSSQAILISSKTSTHSDLITKVKKRFEGYITSTKFMLIQYNVSRSSLKDALVLTPGKRSPTISSLEGEDAVAVSALISKDDTAVLMDKLENVGATDIMLFSLSNSRM
jgi:ATP phosphoribosyltransferase